MLMTSEQKAILRRTKAHYGEKTEKNRRKIWENQENTRQGDLKVKTANIVYVALYWKNHTQTRNPMKLEQNNIEMITALRNHPCSKHSAELNQPLLNQDTAFSKANLLLTDFVCFCGFAVACDGLSVVFAWHFCKSSYENQNQPSTVVHWAECPRQYCVSAGSRLSTNNRFRAPWIELQFLRAYTLCNSVACPCWAFSQSIFKHMFFWEMLVSDFF